MSNAQHAHNTIVEQQAQIETLQRTNAALRTRASHLHTRLLTTLDTLDQLQSSNATELNSLFDRNTLLEKRLAAQNLLLNEAIEERDDLRDAVERFIEKVELSDGFHVLPRSSLTASNQLEPLSSVPRRRSHADDTESGYIPALLQTLQVDLAREKEEHRRTWHDAAAQIATLRAQVARREAELESLTLLGLQEEAEAHSTSSVVDLPKLSKKDAQMLRADLHERRRNLDLEVQKLNAEVEQKTHAVIERHQAYAPASAPLIPPRDTRSVTPAGSPKLRPATADSEGERRTPDEMETEPETDKAPSTPTGPTHKSSNSQTHLTAHIFTNTPLRPSATSVPFTLSKHLPDVFLPATPPTRLPPQVPRSSGRKRSGLVPSSKVTHVVAGLDRQISELSSLVDGLRNERERLMPSDIPTRPGSAHDLEAEMSDAWLLEEECIRLNAALEAKEARPKADVTPGRPSRKHTVRVGSPPMQETPIRRSTNSHLGELPSLLVREQPSSLFSPASGLSGPQTSTASPAQFSTADAGDTSTDDDFHGDGTATYNSGIDSLQLDVYGTGSHSGQSHSADRYTVELEETLRLAREELQRKDDEMQRLKDQMQHLQIHFPVSDTSLSPAPQPPRPPFSSRNTS